MARSLTLALAPRPVGRPSLSSQVAGQIRDGVVAGTLPVGAALPSSRALAARPRGLARGDRAGLRPAGRRGLGRGPARVRARSSPPAPWPGRGTGRPRARPPSPPSSGSTPAPRGSTPGTARRGGAPGATSPRRRLPRRTTTRRAARAARRARRPARPHPRAALRPRRDPGDHRDDRRPEPAAGGAPARRRSPSRTPATGPRPRRSSPPGARAGPPGDEPVTDLTGTVARLRDPRPPAPARPGHARLGPALVDRRGAARAGAVVIEDDYDSEFRYDVAPVPALAALDRDRVAYLGTTSKTVAPSMRLGWLVAPAPLHRAILARRAVTHDVAAWPVQRAFLSLLRDGYVDQVVRSARRTYAARAARVTEALRPHAEPILPVAGMYATVPMPQARALRARASARRGGVRRAAAQRLLPHRAPDRPDHRVRRLHRRRARPCARRDRPRPRLSRLRPGARRRRRRTPRPARARSCGPGSTPSPTAGRRSRRARTSSAPRSPSANAATWISQPTTYAASHRSRPASTRHATQSPSPIRPPSATGRRRG